MIHHADASYNVKARTLIHGQAVNVPRDCDGCGEFWQVDAQHRGARYFHGSRWLCVACRCT